MNRMWNHIMVGWKVLGLTASVVGALAYGPGHSKTVGNPEKWPMYLVGHDLEPEAQPQSREQTVVWKSADTVHLSGISFDCVQDLRCGSDCRISDGLHPKFKVPAAGASGITAIGLISSNNIDGPTPFSRDVIVVTRGDGTFQVLRVKGVSSDSGFSIESKWATYHLNALNAGQVPRIVIPTSDIAPLTEAKNGFLILGDRGLMRKIEWSLDTLPIETALPAPDLAFLTHNGAWIGTDEGSIYKLSNAFYLTLMAKPFSRPIRMLDATIAQSDQGGLAVNENGRWTTFSESGPLFKWVRPDWNSEGLQVFGWLDQQEPARLTLRNLPTRLDNVLPAALAAALNRSEGFLIPKDSLSFQFDVQDSEGNIEKPEFLMIHGGDMVKDMIRNLQATIPGTGYSRADNRWMDGCAATGKCLPGARATVKGWFSQDSIRLTLDILDGTMETICPTDSISMVTRIPRFMASSYWRSGDALMIQVGKDRLALWNGRPLVLSPQPAKSGAARFPGLDGAGSGMDFYGLSGRRIHMRAGSPTSKKIAAQSGIFAQESDRDQAESGKK